MVKWVTVTSTTQHLGSNKAKIVIACQCFVDLSSESSPAGLHLLALCARLSDVI